jgi:dienelactone hydrolase
MATPASTSEELARFLAIGAAPDRVPFETSTRVAKDGYDELAIEYPGDDGEVIPAFLLLPRGRAPLPAVLVEHQHASQWHLGKSEVAGLAGDPLQAFGPALARRGVVVLAPDSIGFEERRANARGTEPGERNSDWLQHYNAMAHRLVRGELLIRRVLRDAMRAVSLLRALPEVDGARIGTIGHSYGGSTALFHAAIDPRVQYACASGAACTFRRKLARGTGLEMSLVIPGFAARFDVDDLVRAICPRPLLLVSGAADVYSEDADEIERAVRPDYEAAGEASALAHRRDKGGHDMTRERFEHIVDWTAARAGA